METPKEYYYTYYSYEEWGRGYIGSRGCNCLPEEDVKYFGSFKDKTFRPTQKIILKDDYATREEALIDEIILHDYYDVANNPHFANKAKQTSTKFYYIIPFGEASKRGKINGFNHKQNKTGICGRSKEKMSEDGKRGTERARELGVGLYGLTTEQKSEAGKKGAEKARELGVGLYGLTSEERSKNAKINYDSGKGVASLTAEQRTENGKKAGNKNIETGHIIELGKKMGEKHKENKTGIFGLSTEQILENSKKGGAIAFEMGVGVHARTKEQMSEDGKKGGSISGKKNYDNGIGLASITKEERKEIVEKTNSQKWMCLETEYVSTAAGVVAYQKARGIDTSKRIRIS
jgi:hypothetical protein